jgi:hypothetical protein
MVDTILALNYSSVQQCVLIYTSLFLKFLRDHQFRDPKQSHKKEIIKYLNLSNGAWIISIICHSMVNALLFYYQQIGIKKVLILKLPRTKSEKKIDPQY